MPKTDFAIRRGKKKQKGVSTLNNKYKQNYCKQEIGRTEKQKKDRLFLKS